MCGIWWLLNCASLEDVLVVSMKFTEFWYVTFYSLVKLTAFWRELYLILPERWKLLEQISLKCQKISVRWHGITPGKTVIFVGDKLIMITHWLQFLLLSAAVCCSFCVRCSSAQTTRSLQGSNFLFKPSFSNTSSKDNVSSWKLDEKSS